MRFGSSLGTAAVLALCAFGLAVTANAADLPPNLAQVLGDTGHAMAAHSSATGKPGTGAIPHGAARDDVSGTSAEPGIVQGERWAANGGVAQHEVPAPARADSVSFDWADAGLGAFAALGAVALLGAAVYGLRSRTAGRPASGAAS